LAASSSFLGEYMWPLGDSESAPNYFLPKDDPLLRKRGWWRKNNYS
jgi:hypothetical protein